MTDPSTADIIPRLRTRIVAFLLLFLLQGSVLAGGNEPGKALPEACRSECVSAYGTVLGVAGKVPAYSNCSAGCVVFSPNKVDGVYTGIEWQCVEYARRWLLQNKGAVYGDVDVAADIWNKIDRLQRVSDKGDIPLKAYPNGSRQAPAVGDLLIYAKAYLGTGHVAVITGVDLSSHTLKVAEENYLNKKWPGDYARKIDMIFRDGKYWVLDAYVLGWKHATE
jgi:hypothetical protein